MQCPIDRNQGSILYKLPPTGTCGALPLRLQVCVDQQQQIQWFCSRWQQTCEVEAEMTGWTSCATDSSKFIFGAITGETSGDTLQCRFYHLGAAAQVSRVWGCTSGYLCVGMYSRVTQNNFDCIGRSRIALVLAHSSHGMRCRWKIYDTGDFPNVHIAQ